MAKRKIPISEFIRSLRGKYKFATGGKSFREWMADLKREEKESEDKKFQKLTLSGKKQF